jgi:hypothetical protein
MPKTSDTIAVEFVRRVSYPVAAGVHVGAGGGYCAPVPDGGTAPGGGGIGPGGAGGEAGAGCAHGADGGGSLSLDGGGGVPSGGSLAGGSSDPVESMDANAIRRQDRGKRSVVMPT